MLDHRKRTGLQLLTDMIEGRLDPPPMARTLNFRLTAAARGEAVFRGTATGDSLNPMGAVHGGWYGAVLDSALGCAVQSVLDAGQIYTTLEYKVNLVRAVPPGTETETRGTVQHAGRTTAAAAAEMRGVADGRLYATGSTTCLIMSA